jgi:hypothetical protein
MNQKQRLAFFLNGLLFVICGGIMGALGFAYSSYPLIGLGGFFVVGGAFWLVIAKWAGRSA